MKKALHLFTSLLITIQAFAQYIPTIDTCLPVPWVNLEIFNDGNSMLLTWEKPCDTCNSTVYRIAWVDGFDYCAGEDPGDGTIHHRAYTTGLSFSDSQWGPRPAGYFTYAIKAQYDTCESVWAYSNTVYKSYYDSLSVLIFLSDGADPIETSVLAEGIISCNLDSTYYSDQTDESGTAYFGEIETGLYSITTSRPGYETLLVDSIEFFTDTTLFFELIKSQMSDTCLPVPWVNIEMFDNADDFLVSWDKPCDTCNATIYELAWVDGFNYCAGEGPNDGTIHHRAFTTNSLSFSDSWWPRPSGHFAFAVKAIYDTCESIWIYSNTVFSPSYTELIVNITLEDGSDPSGTNVLAEGIIGCNIDSSSYLKYAFNNGLAYFGNIKNGVYSLTVSRTDYETKVIDSLQLYSNTTFYVELSKIPSGDTCISVPWVTAEIQGEMVNLNWDVPCEDCNLNEYEVARIVSFNPCIGETPEDGVLSHKEFTTSLSYSAILGWPRFSAYAIKAYYDSCTSPWIYSNLLFPEFDNYPLEVMVFEEGGTELEGAFVSLEGDNVCTQTLSYTEQSDIGGTAYFGAVQEGIYSLTVNVPGFQQYALYNILISLDTSLSVYLTTGNFPSPDQITVDENTGMANWLYFGSEKHSKEIQGFKVYLGDSLVSETESDVFSHQFMNLVHNMEYTASVSARYPSGESEWISNTFTTNFLGNEEIEDAPGISIFPNPAQGVVHIQSEKEISKIEILNSLGQISYQKKTSGKILGISTSRLNSGFYTIRLYLENKVLSRQLIIRKP